MPIIGNAIMVGGGSGGTEQNLLVGFVWGKVLAGSYTTVGAGNTNASCANVDSDFFTYTDGVFTCTKTGIYAITVYGAGQYNNGVRNCQYELFQNSTIISSDTSTSSTGGLGIDGKTVSLPSVSVTVGDTIYLQMKQTNTSSPAAITGALSICVSPSSTVMDGANNLLAVLCSNGPTDTEGTAGTYYLIGIQTDQVVLSACDTDRFTYDAGYFTCVKAGTYTVGAFSSAGRTASSSSTVYSHYKIVKTSGGTDTIVYENTTSIPLSGAAASSQVTLAEGDKLSVWVATVSSVVRVPGGLVISVV